MESGRQASESALEKGRTAALAEREAAVRALFLDGKIEESARGALALYAPELQRFLRVRLRSRELAREAFSSWQENFWVGYPQFGWRSSLRTWCYALARHVLGRAARTRATERRVELGVEPAELAAPVRTTTAVYLQTETKKRVRALREQLDEDLQTLLVLRVDRGLSWRELAVVMDEVDATAPDSELTQAAARMRTRFQAAKQRLRVLAREAGLLNDDESERQS